MVPHVRTSGRRDFVTPRARASTLELLRLCHRTSPSLTVAVVGVTTAGGLLPVAFSLASGATVGALPAAVRAGMDSAAGDRLTRFLVVAVVLFVVMQAMGPVRETLADALLVRVDTAMARRIMALASAPPGVAHLEDPGTVDRLQQAQGAIAGSTPGSAIYALSIIWNRRTAGVAAFAVVLSFRWWLAIGLVAVQAVLFRWRRRAWQSQNSGVFRRSQQLPPFG